MGRIHAGDLTERITWHKPGLPVPDGRLGTLPGPETTQALWAQVEPLKGYERFVNGQTLNGEAYKVTIRYQPTASPKQRITWKGKALNVLAVVADARHEYTQLTCAYGGQ